MKPFVEFVPFVANPKFLFEEFEPQETQKTQNEI
jgi:hypothetical protein